MDVITLIVATILAVEPPTAREFERARWCSTMTDSAMRKAHERYCAHVKEKVRIWQERK